MGRMLEALRQLENRSALCRSAGTAVVERSVVREQPPAAVVEKPAVVEEPAIVEEPVAAEKPGAAVQDQPRPIDPRYRQIAGTILSQLTVGNGSVVLVAGFAGDGTRGGQLAAIYPQLAGHMERGLLVVAADFGGASLAERSDLCCEHGLADVLAGRVGWQDAIRETAHPGLFLLPGKWDQASYRHKSFRKAVPIRLAEVLGELRLAHRPVVVDAVLSSPREMGDWAAMCDAVVLLARLGVTPRRLVRETVGAIRAGGGHVLGCVLLEP